MAAAARFTAFTKSSPPHSRNEAQKPWLRSLLKYLNAGHPEAFTKQVLLARQ
jgi:hypothetical protein